MGNESSDYRHIRKRGQKEKTINVMKLLSLLFPVFNWFKEEPNELEVIAQNNLELAKELEGMPPMSAQEIKKYVQLKEQINLQTKTNNL